MCGFPLNSDDAHKFPIFSLLIFHLFFMSVSRTILLKMSESSTLRNALPRLWFVRRAVKRFMPGERLEDALEAAEQLKRQGFPTILTKLGENIQEMTEAEEVTRHYLDALERIRAKAIDGYISVKLTQMGFDIDKEHCYRLFAELAARGRELRNLVWIDMEGTAYTEDTIRFYERARHEFDNVGLCLQSYLYRTEADLEGLLRLSPGAGSSPLIRLVKGAYKEPPHLAMPRKSDVDESFFQLAGKLLRHTKESGVVHGIGTHDRVLIGRIIEEARKLGLAKDRYEFQMLYGIQTAEQARLRTEGYRVRVLISYGSYWYPWYMRRLAERPANVWFVVKNLFG